MINILIADDHQMFSQGIRNYLEKDPEIRILEEATDGEMVLEHLEKNPHANLMILDIEMPKLNGIEVARIAKKKYPKVKILMLTYHNEADFIFQLFQMGVHGYVLKNKSAENLLGAIHDIVDHNRLSFPMLSESPPPNRHFMDEPIQLTKRETEVLEWAWKNRDEIADELHISVYTVDTHLENMRKKFGVDSTTKLIWEAVKRGYLKP